MPTLRPDAAPSIGPWVRLALLGRGGMGGVYRCHHRDDPARLAAVKWLDDTADPDQLARFETELRALSALDHPGVAAVHDVGVAEGRPYIAMDLIPGAPLHTVWAGPVPRADAVAVVGQLAEILGYAHARGVFHRDLKPANLLLDDGGRLHVVDFGTAVAATVSRITTPDRRRPATPRYAPPEWFAGAGDPASADVYQAAEEPCRLLQQPALLLAARGRGLQPLAPFLTSFVTLLRAAA